MHNFKFLYAKWFPWMAAGTNVLLLALIVLRNVLFQGFCVPVLWCRIVFYVCGVNILLTPFLFRSRGAVVNAIFGGLSLVALIYYTLFMQSMGFICSALLVVELCYLLFVACPGRTARRVALASMLFFALVPSVFFALSYRHASHELQAARENGYKGLKDSYMVERIVGMHFLYHTRFCPYDGWRPPLHDPSMVIGLRINGMDPLHDLTLEERVQLYASLYPDRPLVYCRACSRESRGYGYFTDRLFRQED